MKLNNLLMKAFFQSPTSSTKSLVLKLKFSTNTTGQSSNNTKRFYKESTFKVNDPTKQTKSESDKISKKIITSSPLKRPSSQTLQQAKPIHPMHRYSLINYFFRYLIQLDNKNMRTPYRNVVAVPSKALALLITNQFNMQGKHLKTAEMPMLALSRTAVDADIQGHLAQHLKNTIYEYLKTDTLLFFQDKFSTRYDKTVRPLIQEFNKHFDMNIKPSDSLQPPQVILSEKFLNYINSLNNWQLIGLQTMTIWMKSTISACLMVMQRAENSSKTSQLLFAPQMIQSAAYLEQTVQLQQFGMVQQKIMDINQIKLMVSCGEMLYRLSTEEYVKNQAKTL